MYKITITSFDSMFLWMMYLFIHPPIFEILLYEFCDEKIKFPFFFL